MAKIGIIRICGIVEFYLSYHIIMKVLYNWDSFGYLQFLIYNNRVILYN